MTGELVTAATILAGSGAGAWLADKLLGASAEALGEQIKAFAGHRLRRIFTRAAAKADPASVNALPPGFAIQFVQKASFSEDSDVITEMWASLLVDAGSAVTYRHTVFADILTQMGSDGAKFLGDMVDGSDWEFSIPNEVGLADSLYQRYRKTLRWETLDEQEAAAEAQRLLETKVLWPVRPILASYPHRIPGDNPAATGTRVACNPRPDPLMIDVLARQRLVTEFDFDFQPGWASPRLTGIYLTELGLDLVKTCQKPDIDVGKGATHDR